MIRGTVNSNLESIIRLRLRGPTGIEADVDAILDTGFTGSLTVAAATVAALELAWRASFPGVLADGSRCIQDTYEAEIDWDGTPQAIIVSVVGRSILLGMRLLALHKIVIVAEPGGAVEIEPLP